MNANVERDVDLEALVHEEIPCGGIDEPSIARDCSRPAVLCYAGHPCITPRGPHDYKCLPCWKVFYASVARVIARGGSVRCDACGSQFTDADAFADYRPF